MQSCMKCIHTYLYTIPRDLYAMQSDRRREGQRGKRGRGGWNSEALNVKSSLACYVMVHTTNIPTYLPSIQLFYFTWLYYA